MTLTEGRRPSATAERQAVAVDAAGKQRNLKRVRRIERQVRGLEKMVEDDRYCPDILTQIASVHDALLAVGRELLGVDVGEFAAGARVADTAGAFRKGW